MLSAEARSRLIVVLVGARNPQNIGAAARAMQDFGFGDLRVVNEFAPPFEAAQLEARSAVAAGEVMRAARLFSSLPDAIHDCTDVVGTTAIGGRGLARPVLPLRNVALGIRQSLVQTGGAEAGSFGAPTGGANHLHEGEKQAVQSDSSAKVALLFGSEKTGLTNEQLSHCSKLLTIPMFAPEGRHLSMNLGQSVAVCLYELVRDGFQGSRQLPPVDSVMPTGDDRERLLHLVLTTMEVSGYARRFPANARADVVRQLLLGVSATRDQTVTWVGVFRQLLRRLHPGDEGSAAAECPSR